MSDLWKMLFFTFIFATLLLGFVAVWQGGARHGHCSTTNACIVNLKALEGAKQTWALDNRKQTNDMPVWSDLIGETNYISPRPVCPQGGTYTSGAVGAPARCTIPGHVLPP